MYKRSLLNNILVILSFVVSILSCNSDTKKEVTDAVSIEPSEQEIVDAYTYLYGRYLVIQQENHDINIEKVGYNKIKYNPLGSAQFVNPNLDVAYLEAWMASDSNLAVILNVPKIVGRHYTAQLSDGWGKVITNINERNYPKTPYGKFALVIKGTNPVTPADVGIF